MLLWLINLGFAGGGAAATQAAYGSDIFLTATHEALYLTATHESIYLGAQ
jgi:hypothetical protein